MNGELVLFSSQADGDGFGDDYGSALTPLGRAVRAAENAKRALGEADGLFSSGSESDGEHGGEVNVYVGHVGHRSCHAAIGVMLGLHC